MLSLNSCGVVVLSNHKIGIISKHEIQDFALNAFFKTIIFVTSRK